MPRCQGAKKCPRCQGAKVLRCPVARALGQGAKVLRRCQGAKVPRCQGALPARMLNPLIALNVLSLY